MPHDYKTKTVDYNEDKPPEWYTSQERIDYYPARAAWFVCREIDRVEALYAAKNAASGDTPSGEKGLRSCEEESRTAKKSEVHPNE